MYVIKQGKNTIMDAREFHYPSESTGPKSTVRVKFGDFEFIMQDTRKIQMYANFWGPEVTRKLVEATLMDNGVKFPSDFTYTING